MSIYLCIYVRALTRLGTAYKNVQIHLPPAALDVGKVKGEQLHIVIRDKNGGKHALNVDGTWKHGGTSN